MELTNRRVISDICERYGFSFSKGLGQNFLVDSTVCPKIAEMGNASPGFGVLEIGTGFGVLTKELAKRADRVAAVEIDSRLMPVLDETLSEFDNIRIVNADVMKTDLHSLIDEEFTSRGLKAAVCANLPYYITSPVIMHLLESRLNVESVTVMVQREAAVRLCAEPGTRECGAVSFAVRYYSKPEILFKVSRGCFYPSPNVDSAVIRLNILKTPPIETDEKLFFKAVRGAFNGRRKTLANSLSRHFQMDKSEVNSAIEAAGLPLTVRPEALTMEQMAAVVRMLPVS